jgi:hypothetical protein
MPPAGSGSYPNYHSNPGYGSNPGFGQSPGYNTQPGYPSQPDLNGNMPSGPISGGLGPMGPSGGLNFQVPPQLAQRLADYHYIPRRLTMINPADMASLDRRARQLLLLVDNRRSIADLIRLTRRSDDEIRALLAHLISLGLVD